MVDQYPGVIIPEGAQTPQIGLGFELVANRDGCRVVQEDGAQ